ncbi:hypothetical protein GCM10020358_55790 [Amorphoplanes nipponensis]|uniref:Excreted virulence factor EspC, type VII ESX diderm n=1 Tax=Actinoplanes nipponensis TaxID=135950 RepID=A0A919JMJ1_9ACTN|nr:type VII secretion target [Actinoplanes nipponensis]GIE51927.1 hypothetical protein Ani05nite_54610 [Actinoplanes nipponensis]
MDKLAERLESAADALSTVDRSLSAHSASPGAFGADDAGTPGRLGRELHARWQAVLAARAQEAAAVSARLTTLAADIRLTGRAYNQTDDEAGRRIRRSM